ncbi:MAG: enoyl-CoA hydratase/isomerase family protein [Nitrospirota bacterium]|nr:MAG: enoyl-CoA hydratase/isomerase family protein [Nitrospirota bacterium]
MLITRNDRIVTWELNRPGQDNGLDIATFQAMESSLTELEHEAQRLNCLLVYGGLTVFSTGLDSELLKICFGDAAIFHEVVERLNRVLDRLEALPFISIACIEGLCKLGGLELALACDLIVAGESAMISDGHLAYDAMPGGGATRRLPPRLGYSGSLRFILQRETLTATEACKRGLVDEAVPRGQAPLRGKAIAEALSKRHPSLVHGIKTSLRAAAPRVPTRREAEEFQRTVIDRLGSR